MRDVAEGLRSCMDALLERRRTRLGRATDKLEALSPLAALRRGYAVAQSEDGRVLRSVQQFRDGDRFRLRVVDGRVVCIVDSTESDEDG